MRALGHSGPDRHLQYGAELKRAGIGYKELAERLNKHGLEETETSITGKLARGAFAVSFFLACLAVLEMEGVRLEDL